MLTFSFESELRNIQFFSIEFYKESNNINDNDELLFYTYLKSRTNNSNIVEIKCSDILEQKFEYLKNEKYKNIFPLSFYELIQKENNKDKQFIFQILDLLPSDSELNEKNLLIKGYILNKTTVEDIKINPKFLEKEKIIANGEYSNNLLAGNIVFTKEIIQEYAIYKENYFFISIKSSNDDVIELDYIEIDLFKSSFTFIDINKYVVLKVKDKENKHLLLSPKQDTGNMAIDFFVEGKTDISDYNIAIRAYTDDNDDYSKNETYIIIPSDFKYGRYCLMVLLKSDYHYIVADIIKVNNNNNNDEDDNYILKYRITESEPTYYYLDPDRNVTYELNNYDLNMNFNGVRECDKDCTFHDNFEVNYIIRFYDNSKFGTKKINNIIVNEKPLYEYSLTKKGKEETKERVNWKVKIKKFDEKEQLVQIVGYGSLDGNEESFVYGTLKIHYEQILNDRSFEFWIIFGSFIAIIIITYIAMYVYIYAKLEIGRRTLMLNNSNAISMIQRPSDRTSGNTNTRMTI